MKKSPKIGLVFILLIIISACGKSKFYGEYSVDGNPRYDIKILDNNTAKINLESMITVEYEKNGDRLEVIQDDVYSYYVDSVTGVFFELKDDDTLSYNIVKNSEEMKIGEFKYIE
ncbi:hypothetical protein [Salinibacillus xinjiangensis]|uniref:DUF3139 domain-containing protein n=1 Tax=Salinibacillus xinjiangensis TaxID=1229268 RepID=A0A6G1X222_9BACI|nr:hypothetical protein [Salinibacillus xinjiangensis]MRG85033.1 hypothetical protein [Salinibacillus xinjiangensis]